MTLPTIDQSIVIDADRSRTWAVLTEPDLVGEWLGCMDYRAEVGALFHMQPDPLRRAAGSVEGATCCEVEAIVPMDRLAFSWFLPGTPKTHVEIVLTGALCGPTTARLVHSGWDRFDAESIRPVHNMLSGGWSGFVLPNLKRTAERA